MDSSASLQDDSRPAQLVASLQTFTSDSDPRVRTEAIESLVSKTTILCCLLSI